MIADLSPPDFSIDGMFTVTLKRPLQKVGEKVDETLSGNQLKIIEAMKNDSRITFEELSRRVGITEVSIHRNVKKLRELNIVKRIGPAKGGHWEVNI